MLFRCVFYVARLVQFQMMSKGLSDQVLGMVMALGILKPGQDLKPKDLRAAYLLLSPVQCREGAAAAQFGGIYATAVSYRYGIRSVFNSSV